MTSKSLIALEHVNFQGTMCIDKLRIKIERNTISATMQVIQVHVLSIVRTSNLYNIK